MVEVISTVTIVLCVAVWASFLLLGLWARLRDRGVTRPRGLVLPQPDAPLRGMIRARPSGCDVPPPAVRDAVLRERERCAALVLGAEPWIGQEWAERLTDVIRAGELGEKQP